MDSAELEYPLVAATPAVCPAPVSTLYECAYCRTFQSTWFSEAYDHEKKCPANPHTKADQAVSTDAIVEDMVRVKVQLYPVGSDTRSQSASSPATQEQEPSGSLCDQIVQADCSGLEDSNPEELESLKSQVDAMKGCILQLQEQVAKRDEAEAENWVGVEGNEQECAVSDCEEQVEPVLDEGAARESSSVDDQSLELQMATDTVARLQQQVTQLHLSIDQKEIEKLRWAQRQTAADREIASLRAAQQQDVVDGDSHMSRQTAADREIATLRAAQQQDAVDRETETLRWAQLQTAADRKIASLKAAQQQLAVDRETETLRWAQRQTAADREIASLRAAQQQDAADRESHTSSINSKVKEQESKSISQKDKDQTNQKSSFKVITTLDAQVKQLRDEAGTHKAQLTQLREEACTHKAELTQLREEACTHKEATAEWKDAKAAWTRFEQQVKEESERVLCEGDRMLQKFKASQSDRMKLKTRIEELEAAGAKGAEASEGGDKQAPGSVSTAAGLATAKREVQRMHQEVKGLQQQLSEVQMADPERETVTQLLRERTDLKVQLNNLRVLNEQIHAEKEALVARSHEVAASLRAKQRPASESDKQMEDLKRENRALRWKLDREADAVQLAESNAEAHTEAFEAERAVWHKFEAERAGWHKHTATSDSTSIARLQSGAKPTTISLQSARASSPKKLQEWQKSASKVGMSNVDLGSINTRAVDQAPLTARVHSNTLTCLPGSGMRPNTARGPPPDRSQLVSDYQHAQRQQSPRYNQQRRKVITPTVPTLLLSSDEDYM